MVTVALGWLLVSAFLVYVLMSKRLAASLTPQSKRARRLHRYSPRIRLAAIAGLVIWILLASTYGAWLYHCDLKLRDKFVVLVADLSGPRGYGINEELVAQLRASFDEYGDTVVRALGQIIPEQQGNERARALGKRYRADLVLWGWYVVTGSNVRHMVHIENLSPSRTFILPSGLCHTVTVPVTEIESFSFQQRLAGEMSAFSLLLSGTVRFELGDYQGTVQRVSAALQPRYWPEALFGQEYPLLVRANAYLKMDRLEDALLDYHAIITLYSECLESDSTLVMTHNNRGIVYARQDEYERAIEDYNQAIAIDPEFAPAYNNRGVVYEQRDEYELAIQDYDRAIALSPEDVAPLAYSNRAHLYANLGKPELAIKDYEQAIASDPRNACIYFSRGLTYLKLSEYERAIEDYDRAIAIGLECADAYTNRGNAYVHLGEYERAIEDYDRAIAIGPEYPETYTNRGNAYLNLGKYERAIEDLNHVISIAPDCAESYINRGFAYYSWDRYELAIEDCTQAIAIDPEFASAYNTRGSVYYSWDRYELAIEDYTRAIVIDPEYTSAYYNRGLAYIVLDKYEQVDATVEN